jgi:ubiquinone/menaquinone biosynthesis C-methylase UbiE
MTGSLRPRSTSDPLLKRFWDEYAQCFGFWDESRYYRDLVKDIFEAANVRSNLNCIDVGCGTGIFTALLARSGASVTAVDLSSEMILRAGERLARTCTAEQVARVKFQQGDAEEFLSSQPSDSHDLIIASLVLSYLPNYRRVAQEIYRVLRSPSVFVMSNPVPNYKVTRIFAQSLCDIIRDVPRFMPAALNLLRYVLQIRKLGRLGVFHFFTYDETKRLLCNAGFAEAGISIRHSFGSQVFLARAEK